MPDGDRISSKLSLPYRTPYKQVCEARLSPYELVRSVLKPFIADIKRQGNGPISRSRSCDRMRHAWPDHCGSCSSCLLRRQALAAAGIEDLTDYMTSFRTASQATDELHFVAMQSQVALLVRLLNRNNAWEGLSERFPELSVVPDIMAGQNDVSREYVAEELIRLYQAYVEEWRRVENRLYTGLTMGGAAWPTVTEEGGRSMALWTN